MADTFGAVEVPVQTGEPAGDPALGHIGDYLKTILNAKAQDAFDAAALAGVGTPVVRAVYQEDPSQYVFDDCELPALCVYRARGSFETTSQDFHEDVSEIRVVWMIPHDRCRKVDARHPFFNAVAKLIAKALRAGIDPLWSFDGDSDPLAAYVEEDTDSIKLSAATSVLAETYSGTDLNGALGEATMSPRLEPTITTTEVNAEPDDPGIPNAGDDGPGGTDVYNTNESVVWTVIDWGGRTRTLTARLTLPLGGETIGAGEDVAEVVSVYIPPQLSARGTIALGTGEFIGRGSELLEATKMASLRATGWRPLLIRVEELDASGRKARTSAFEAVEVVIAAQEREIEDLTDETRFHPHGTPPYGAGVDIDVTKDGLLVTRAQL